MFSKYLSVFAIGAVMSFGTVSSAQADVCTIGCDSIAATASATCKLELWAIEECKKKMEISHGACLRECATKNFSATLTPTDRAGMMKPFHDALCQDTAAAKDPVKAGHYCAFLK